MPIKNNNFENFYQGGCAEMHISSLFYFAGYEASKISPDSGIDMVVTNIARSKFKNEMRRISEIQVKSTLLDDSGAVYSLDGSELNFLCSGEDRFTVFVLLHGFSGGIDPSSFDIYADSVDKMIDLDIARYEEGLMEKEGRQRRKDGIASIFDFSQAKLATFWLNSAQMERAREEGYWKKSRDEDRYFLKVNLSNNAVQIDDTFLIPELTDVRYIMRDCRSAGEIKNGKFSYDHL